MAASVGTWPDAVHTSTHANLRQPRPYKSFILQAMRQKNFIQSSSKTLASATAGHLLHPDICVQQSRSSIEITPVMYGRSDFPPPPVKRQVLHQPATQRAAVEAMQDRIFSLLMAQPSPFKSLQDCWLSLHVDPRARPKPPPSHPSQCLLAGPQTAC